MIVDVPRLLDELGIGHQRRGPELWAPCPYPGHDDGEPSWSIVDSQSSDRHGFNNCFGCGESGGALDLVMGVVGLSGYAAAAFWIRERGLDVEGPGPLSINLVVRRTGARRRLLPPRGLWGGDLSAWPTPARRYVLGRGLTAQQVNRWGLMYAVDGDLAGRIWLPTADASGELLDWTARSYCGAELRYRGVAGGGAPGAIFGERYWPPVLERAARSLVLCEGALNGLACERAGAELIGAIGGAERYDRWVTLKLGGFGEVVVATDPDQAGDRVAALASTLARVPGRCSVRRVELPPGADCDKLWSKDPDELRRRLWGGTALRDGPRAPTRRGGGTWRW